MAPKTALFRAILLGLIEELIHQKRYRLILVKQGLGMESTVCVLSGYQHGGQALGKNGRLTFVGFTDYDG